jgi:hypothetical protein
MIAMAHPKPIHRAEKIQAVQRFIFQAPVPPYAYTKRVRDLTWTEARDIVFGLSGRSFHLDDSVVEQFTAKRDADGNIIVSPPSQPAAGSAKHAGVFGIRPDVICGLQFLYIPKFTSHGNIQKTVRQGHISNLDPRLLVLLTWMCERLRDNWGTQFVYHRGFAGDASHKPNDAHNWGRALDFAGVAGVSDRAYGSYHLTVLKNWGMFPITMPVDWGHVDHKTKKHEYQKGKQYPHWPDGFQDTTYRLAMPDDSDAIAASGTAQPEVMFVRRVFQDVYDLVATEGKDTANPMILPRRSAKPAASSSIRITTARACASITKTTSTCRSGPQITQGSGGVEPNAPPCALRIPAAGRGNWCRTGHLPL